MGKYVSQIGLVVIVSLLFSLVEAVILLPAHLAHSAALSEEARNPAPLRARLLKGQDYLVNRVYAPALEFALGHRAVVLSILAGAIMISAGAFAGQHIKAAFFPEIESPYVYAEFSFPAGTTAVTVDEFRERTERFMLDFGALWAEDDPDHDNAVVDYLSWGNGTKLWVYLILLDNDVRDFTINEFSLALAREMPEDPVLESMFIGNDTMFGGSPISIRFLGRSDKELRLAADLFKAELARMEGVKDIRDDTPLGEKEFVISLNDRGRALGLTTADVAGQLRIGFYGSEIMTLQDGREEVPVIVRYPLDERDSLSRVEDLLIHTPAGARIPFREIADYKIQRSQRRIRRENGYPFPPGYGRHRQ